MQIDAHLDELRTQGNALATAAVRAGLDTEVPACPGWRVRQLIGHTGAVHRWAVNHIRAGTDRQRFDIEAPSDEELLDANELIDWYRDSHDLLLNALIELPADWQCWTFFAAESPRTFWARRQAHETAMHRADCDQAVRGSAEFATEFAVDGIDELLSCFVPRRCRGLVSQPERSLLVQPDDSPAWWHVTIAADGHQTRTTGSPDADCVIAGSASDLYLWLWNRPPVTAPRLVGDESLAELWQAQARI
jgi:uncharacterized protein (TIGR03083 family)